MISAGDLGGHGWRGRFAAHQTEWFAALLRDIGQPLGAAREQSALDATRAVTAAVAGEHYDRLTTPAGAA
jgi:hypothetical protein